MDRPTHFASSGHNTANAANKLRVKKQKNVFGGRDNIFIVQPPPRRRGSLATGWIESNTRLPAGESPTEWVDFVRDFISQSEATRLKDEYEALWNEDSKPFDDFKQVLRDEASGSDMFSTWPEVMEELRRAKEYYQGGYRRQSTIPKMLIAFGKHAASFSKWLKHLPRKDYSAPVCGAFKRILSYTIDAHKLDKTDFGAIARIPAIIDSASQYLKVCSDDRWTVGLAKKTIELFNIIFLLLTKVLEAISESVEDKAAHKSGIEDLVEKLESYMNDLDLEARRCNNVALDQPEEQRREKMQHQPGIQIYVTFHCLNSSNPQLDRNGQLIPQEIRVSSVSPSRNKRPRSSNESTPEVQKPPSITSKALVRLLVYNPVLIATDVDECGIPSNLEEGQMQRLSKLTNTEIFQTWLREEEKPSAILVHGGFENSNILSPTSFLCARLIYAMTDAYQTKDKAVMLSYFCGQRSDPWDPRANAAGIMVDLIGQLLSQVSHKFEFDLTFIDKKWERKISNDDLVYLCRLFRKLVWQLSGCRMVVFCLIDSITAYEATDRRGTKVLVERLTRLVRGLSRKRSKLVFKLLVADSASSLYAWEPFEGDEKLEMGEDSDGDDEEDLNI